MKLDAISILRRAESKMRRDYVMGGDVRFGERRKFFAGAITPGGIKSNVTSVIEGVGRVVVLDVPVGSRTEVLLGPVSRRLTEAGFDVEEYYCPMSPERKLEAKIRNTPITLTRYEYLILQLLMSSPSKVFTKNNIFESVWNENFIGDDNAINVHIGNLRKKFAKVNPEEKYIQTVWGLGFKMQG